MSASMRGAVCYVLVFILPILYATNDPTLNDVLTALEKMVSFYKVTHSEMNLDGIYGLRVLEGQILLLLMEYEKGRHQHLPLSVVARLHMLHQRARNVSERSLPFLANQDKAYYNKLRPLVEKPFMVAHEYRRVDLTLRWIQTEKQRREVPFDEEFSDRCMAELMGTERTDGRTCIMSPQCLDAMFIRGTGEYQITHQLIYMMLVEQENCVAALNQWLRANGWPGGMSQLYLEFCSNNLLEMQQQMLALDGAPIPIYQDLFMEQQFVCPVLGFMEFLHVDWLRQILGWQKANGCFGRMPVTDFAKNYKDMHQLDYQYEGDTPSSHRPPQAGHQEQSLQQQQQQQQQQQGGQYEQHPLGDNRISNMAAANRGSYVDKESAVIQHSNKLQLVGGTGNNNSFPNINVNTGQGVGASSQKATKQRQIVKRSAINTYGTQGYDYINNGKSKGDSRGRKQRQLSKKSRNHQKQSTHQDMETRGVGTGQHTDGNRKRVKQNKRVAPRKGSNSEGYVNEESPVLNADQRTNLKNGGWSILSKDFSPYNGKQQEGEFLIRRLHRLKQPNAPSHLGARRRLLVERDLADNCLSHKTAVAAGALSQYLRFLVNPGTPEFRSHYRMDGPNVILNPEALLPPANAKQGILLHDGHHHQKKKKNPSVAKMSKGGKLAKGAGNNGKGAAGGAQRKGQQQPRVLARRGKQAAKAVLKVLGGGGGVGRGQQQQELVVPRPHPDDMIHSEANENAGGGDVEDTHPQDYYDPDDDQEEDDDDQEEDTDDGPEESYHNVADPPGHPVAPLHHRPPRPLPPGADLPKLSLHHARFRQVVGAGGGGAGDVFDRRVGVGGVDTNKGDEEYEQYVDDEEDQGGERVRKIDLLSPPRRGGGPARRVVINVPAGETAREAHHDEDTYSYYDKEDSVVDPPPAAPMQRRVKLAPPHAYRAPRRTQRPPARPKASTKTEVGEQLIGVPSHPGVGSPPGRIYMVLFCVMILLLVFMYRFVKKRRIVIRYPRTSFR